MNFYYLIGLVVATLVGMLIGYGIEKAWPQIRKIAFDDYLLIVNKINNDETLVAEVKFRFINQLHNYMTNMEMEVTQLHSGLQVIINKVLVEV